MIADAIWLTVVFFGVLDLLLAAERLERTAQRYCVCWHCQCTPNGRLSRSPRTQPRVRASGPVRRMLVEEVRDR